MRSLHKHRREEKSGRAQGNDQKYERRKKKAKFAAKGQYQQNVVPNHTQCDDKNKGYGIRKTPGGKKKERKREENEKLSGK